MATKKVQGLHVEITGDVSGLRKALYEAEKEAKRTQDALKLINKSIKLDPKNIESYATKQGLLTRSISETAKALDKEKTDMKKLQDEGADPLSKEYVQLQTRITELNKRLEEQVKELNILSPEMQKHLATLDRWGTKLEDIGKKTRIFSTAMAGVATASVKSAMEYEEATASIRKVVKNLSDDTVNDLKQLAVDTGTAFSDLAEYATIAGTLGLAEDEISIFTKVMNDLNTATDGSIFGEDGAKKVARFLNVMHENISDVDRFGSALVYVSDQFAATADEVLDVSSGLSGLGALAGVTSADLVGMAVELKNLGVGTAVASSSIQKVMLQIEKEVQSSGDNLAKFAEVSQMPVDNFVNYWNQSPMKAFLRFVDGLKTKTINDIDDAIAYGTKDVMEYANALGMTREQFIKAWNEDDLAVIEAYADATQNMDEETISASKTLNDLSITSVRVLGTMLKLAGHGNEVAHATSDFNKAWAENVALGDKANTMYETTARQLKGTFEAIKQAGAEIGEVMLPTIQGIAEKVKDFAHWFKEADPWVKKLTTSGLLFGAMLSPVSTGLGKLFQSVSGVGTALGKGSKIFKFLKVTEELTKLKKEFGEGKPLSPNVQSLFSSFISESDLAKSNTAYRRIGELEQESAVLEKQMGKTGTATAKLVSKIGGLMIAHPVATALGAFSIALGGAYLRSKKVYKEIDGNIEKLDQYRQAMDSAKESANDYWGEQVRGVEQGRNYWAQIDGMIENLGTLKRGSQDYRDAVAEIKEKVGDMNESLGDSYIYFDEQNKVLRTVKDNAELTAHSYNELAKEIKRSTWLEAHREEYKEALKIVEQAKRDEINAWTEAQKLEAKLSEDQLKDLRTLQESRKGEALTQNDLDVLLNHNKQNAEEMQKVVDAYMAWANAEKTVADNAELIEQLQNGIIKNYERIESMGADEAAAFIQAYSAGIDLGQDYNGLLAQLAEGVALVNYLQEQGTEASLEGAKEVMDANSLIIQKLQELGYTVQGNGDIVRTWTDEFGNTRETIVGHIDGIDESMLTLNQDTETTAETAETELSPAMENVGTVAETAIQKGIDKLTEFNNTPLQDKSMTIRIRQVMEGVQGGLANGINNYNRNMYGSGSGGFGSGGFGTERILNNFRRAMQGMQLAYASGGYNVTVNNTFSVNTLDRTQAMRFSDVIIDQLDERLGRRLR